MADSVFWKGLALWLGGFAVLALVGGSVLGLAFLGVGQSPPAMDDLHLSNHDDANHTVAVEIHPANGSSATFERTVNLAPDERVSFDGATTRDGEYRLLVTVDDGESASFEIEGPDDLCTTEVTVGPNATVEAGMACA